MNRDELIDYLVNRGYVVSARGITVLADTSASGVNLGDDGTICRSSQPGRYLVVGNWTADSDADLIEHAAKCAS